MLKIKIHHEIFEFEKIQFIKKVNYETLVEIKICQKSHFQILV